MSTSTVPDSSITVTLTRADESPLKLYARDPVTFTCQVEIHENVDSSLNVSLTWVREFHGQITENLTNYINSTYQSTAIIFERQVTVSLSSLDWRVSCKSVVNSQDGRYILSSEEGSHTISLDVTGNINFAIINSYLL